MSGNKTDSSLPRLLQAFFCDRLIAQRNASRRTVASYRDAFRLFLRYASQRLGKPPVELTLEDIGVSTTLDFLDYLEAQRGNSVRTRNARLAAIRSFMQYASYYTPEALPTIQRVLAIPTKRFDRPLLGFLSRDEITCQANPGRNEDADDRRSRQGFQRRQPVR